MIVREMYLNILNKYRDKKLIKVITGIRRSAKSTLLPLYLNQLIESSVKEEQIISINLEDFDYYDLLNTKAIYAYIMERISNGKKSHGKIYIFLDEILQVENFERVVNSLYIQEGINLYVTDWNANLLSSELSTLLSGRYVEKMVLPLSYKEYAGGSNQSLSKKELYNKYIKLLRYHIF